MARRIPLAAVIGEPIAHSKSPKIHNHWLAELGLEGHYIPLHVSQGTLKQAFDQMKSLGFVGANLTIPHKEDALNLCHSLSDAAQKIGAVNTVRFDENGQIYGDNSDWIGFRENIKSVVPQWRGAGHSALVLGAGGAARAIIYALQQVGYDKIIVTNRNGARADALCEEFGHPLNSIPWNERAKSLDTYDFIVNTTSLGMSGQPELDLPLNDLKSSAIVTDIVYTPLKTNLLIQAEERGVTTVDGLGMLLHQAIPGFEMWFGVRPTVDEALRALVLG